MIIISLGKLNNEDIRSKVKNIVNGNRVNGKIDIPNELEFLPEYYEHPSSKLFTDEEISLTCLACEAAVSALIDLYIFGYDLEQITNALEGLCELLGIIDMEVCHGGIANYAPIIEYIILNREPWITAGEICGAVVGPGCGKWEEINDWTIDIPEKESKQSVNKVFGPPQDDNVMKVLHITDIHIDLTYTIGNEAKCQLPMCCGNTSGIASSEETSAGYWGDYNCDIPAWSYRRMLEHIQAEHNLDYIMITGDYPAHDVWLQSREHNLATAEAVLKPLAEIFPDTQVVPSLGNHEPFPCNIIPGSTAGVNEEYQPDWLLSQLSEYFSAWLPQPQLDSFTEIAGYTYSWIPGFRVISFPSPLCLTYNFWLWMDFSDPGNMLDWLVEQLLLAEAANEKVHILSHVPPGNGECLGAWGREYSRIINRFEDTIVGQFHGHTHYDHFVIHYDPKNTSRPTNVGYISPSVATYTGLSPGYRIYVVDKTTFKIVDTETWIQDLPSSNIGGENSDPVWYKLYGAKQDLEMNGLEPSDWENLVKRLVTDDQFYEKWINFFKKAGPYEVRDKWQTLCDLLTTSNLDRSKCDEIIGPE